MFEEDYVVILNEVIVSCRDAETRYDTAAEIIDDENLKAVFTHVSGSRNKTALGLEVALKDMGNLPMAPDPEKETLLNLWTRARLAVGKNNEHRILYEDSMRLEKQVAEHCNRALAHELPGGIRRLIENLKQHSAAFRQWLETGLDH